MRLVTVGAADVAGGFHAWRMWWMLARNDIARKYRRSRVGQLWLTLSMAGMVLGMGAVYSTLFNTPMASYLPHVGAGIILWGLISSTITESCTSFTENENIIRQIALPRFSYLLRMLSRNLIVFGHNLLILPIVIVLCGVEVNARLLLFIPGLLLVLVNLAWIGYVLAILSVRFRDIPQIISSLMQIAFFVSPVVFKPSQLGATNPILLLNPFASMLDVMRQPLLGELPSIVSYGYLGGMVVLGWLLALAFAGKYSHRVVYWL